MLSCNGTCNISFAFNILITARKRSLGQVIFFAPVCHSVHRGEYLGRYPRWAGTPPWAGAPPRQVHPPLGRYTSGQFMQGYGRQVGGTRPTGIQSCFYHKFQRNMIFFVFYDFRLDFKGDRKLFAAFLQDSDSLLDTLEMDSTVLIIIFCTLHQENDLP